MARSQSQGLSSARSEIVGSRTDPFKYADSNISDLYQRDFAPNTLTEKQELIADAGLPLAKAFGEFFSNNADKIQKNLENATIDKKIKRAFGNVSTEVEDKLKQDLIYAIRKDLGGDPTDRELREIVQKEFQPQLAKVRDFIFDSVAKFTEPFSRYNVSQLYTDAKNFHKNEIYNVSFESSYNRRIMTIMNSASEFYLKEITNILNKKS
jgi:hypothetical protein